MSLDDIRAREQAATTAPWRAVPVSGRADVRAEPGVGYDYRGQAIATAADSEFGACHAPDAEFIAHARTDIPRLLAALDAVQSLSADLAKTNDPCGLNIDDMVRAAIETALEGGAA